MTNKRAELNDAISAAHEALDEIDCFDLRSADPESVAEMDKLNTAHDKAVQLVIKLAKEQ